MTPTKFIVILDSFPADLRGIKGLEGSVDLFFTPAFHSTTVGSLLSWPLAGGRKVSDNLLTTASRMDYFSSSLKFVEAASFPGP